MPKLKTGKGLEETKLRGRAVTVNTHRKRRAAARSTGESPLSAAVPCRASGWPWSEEHKAASVAEDAEELEPG